MGTGKRYPKEMRERAVRLVEESRSDHESEWASISSVAAEISCMHETLRRWVRQAQTDSGEHRGLTSDKRKQLRELQRENRELKRSNQIVRKALAFSAQAELDRKSRY